MDDARQQMIEITLETRMEVEDLRARESRLLTEAQELQRVAQLDALTGIPNRGEFDKRFEEMLEARRKGDGNSNLGVLMIDVDHFKSFNDTHGHLAGDEVLKSVAQWMRDTVRPTDFLARYGGEEFAIILPNVNEIEAATVGERVRAAIEFGALEWEGTQLKVTASIGGATADVRSQELSAKELIKAADVCLYESKEAGRNQVTCRLM
jgi:diguanylate cyclase (GGDEF)-like protein